MSSFENLELGADALSALKSADRGEVLTKSIDYTRPLNEYPKSEQIVNHLMTEGNARKHIYTKDLNVNGTAVQDKMEKYLEAEGLQSSHLKQALKTPLHLGFSLDEDKKQLEKLKGRKPYFELGEYLHQCILEPTKFSRVIVEPNENLASHDGAVALMNFWETTINNQGFGYNDLGEQISAKELFNIAGDVSKEYKETGSKKTWVSSLKDKKTWVEFVKQFSGLQVVSEEHNLKIQILKKHYDNYGGGILKELLLHSKREISFYTETEDGLKLKVRPDAIQFAENIGVNAIISVKSTACEDLRAFYYNAAKLDYDLSEGMYQDVVSQVTTRDFNTTIMIMLQTVAPFGIAVLVWSAEDIETGKYKFRTGLQVAKECKEKGIYQGYEVFAADNTFGLIDMKLPTWNNKELLPTNI